jgi:membrane protein DedA with SNARE-associated domain
MMHMAPWRFYLANVLSAVIWAPLLVYSGDLLTRSLGHENLATKIFSIAVVGALAVLIAAWLRRQFHP